MAQPQVGANQILSWKSELSDLEDQIQALQDAKRDFYASIRDQYGKPTANGLKGAMKLHRMDSEKRAEADEIDAETFRILTIIENQTTRTRAAHDQPDQPTAPANPGGDDGSPSVPSLPVSEEADIPSVSEDINAGGAGGANPLIETGHGGRAITDNPEDRQPVTASPAVATESGAHSADESAPSNPEIPDEPQTEGGEHETIGEVSDEPQPEHDTTVKPQEREAVASPHAAAAASSDFDYPDMPQFLKRNKDTNRFSSDFDGGGEA